MLTGAARGKRGVASAPPRQVLDPFPTRSNAESTDMPRGTFTSTGTTDPVKVGDGINLGLIFTSGASGSVKLQRKQGSEWADVPNGLANGQWTGSTQDIVYSGSYNDVFRLNCTAVSGGSGINWWLGD